MNISSFALQILETVGLALVSGLVGAMVKHATNMIQEIRDAQVKAKEEHDADFEELKEKLNRDHNESLERIHALETKMAEEYERRKSAPSRRNGN